MAAAIMKVEQQREKDGCLIKESTKSECLVCER